MSRNSTKNLILLLLALLTGGSEVFNPLLASMDDARPYLLVENLSDFDDVEESSESDPVASFDTATCLRNHIIQMVCDEVNHQFDWLCRHEQSARAPPLG